ncbi:hypothetical protein FCL49_02585 [Serratia proteamaculans]|uniref:hypothetical protein n=1 Tax=Serratia TaxID=613 RepID=UPI00157765A0|nr:MULTISPECIES: hypothetical protein [Serratia]NTX78777.1 hypothetical protein [Serratia proteamaculans]NTZ26982.1 hypothetical protein [Serratia proteamaculans]CAI0850139.1 Uncharacterised protein [Serratia quinivorans]
MKVKLNEQQLDELYSQFYQTAGQFSGESLALFLSRLNLLLLDALADEPAARELIAEAARFKP